MGVFACHGAETQWWARLASEVLATTEAQGCRYSGGCGKVSPQRSSRICVQFLDFWRPCGLSLRSSPPIHTSPAAVYSSCAPPHAGWEALRSLAGTFNEVMEK
ncbi:hypothetical protein O3P69_008991 [Scylla paramamosain]|uniref:Uncharacterized protein n=1 Tax=Scylla paramamosain TaxID=85552 RepID=A0AAW0TQE0_SCYPA